MHFELYQEFTICTDHQALKFLQSMKNSNSRLTRWALAIQPFQFVIVHKPGLDNTNADRLSRQAWEEEDAVQDEGSMKKGTTSRQKKGKGVLEEPSFNY